MEKESHDVTAASHMASDGTIPTPEDFDEQRQDLNPTVFPSFGGAVERAIAAFAEFGRMVAVRCPRELAHVMQRAGGVWEPGSRRWLIRRTFWQRRNVTWRQAWRRWLRWRDRKGQE
jgi:hypothetical protein